MSWFLFPFESMCLLTCMEGEWETQLAKRSVSGRITDVFMLASRIFEEVGFSSPFNGAYSSTQCLRQHLNISGLSFWKRGVPGGAFPNLQRETCLVATGPARISRSWPDAAFSFGVRPTFASSCLSRSYLGKIVFTSSSSLGTQTFI